MQPSGLGLRRRATAPALLERFAAAHPSVTLGELPRHRARRGHWARPPAPNAIAGFTWDLRDRRALHWWPQGIDVIPAEGRRPALLVVSWFSQRGRASRVTLVDVRPTAPRYWHVALVVPADDGWTPVRAHAGGVAVIGDRLCIAATHGGLQEFRMSGLVELAGRLALPRTAVLKPHPDAEQERMRYSFVAREAPHERPGLVVGEWRPEVGGRLGRMTVDADALPQDDGRLADLHDPGIPNMQGVLTVGDTWFVSSSNGDRAPGDLWVGRRGSLVRLAGELAPGPEDLALWPERGQLWTVSEFPGRRWVYALDAAEVTARAARVAAAAR